ncbi:hypothetical protein FPOAC1_006532 [Fusarium poae]|jgi:hypothetical protein|uniref:hypothetical protein n=1 Tax=Fusarium poae TaxID=36050 RepID=UPI001CE77B85|nr:hypothetical protein FPOAC1_006532 [Fusarium poae]KAG8673223.1 hypothetical protein FPOAC1_006532 [Fusarium poae]
MLQSAAAATRRLSVNLGPVFTPLGGILKDSSPLVCPLFSFSPSSTSFSTPTQTKPTFNNHYPFQKQPSSCLAVDVLLLALAAAALAAPAPAAL